MTSLLLAAFLNLGARSLARSVKSPGELRLAKDTAPAFCSVEGREGKWKKRIDHTVEDGGRENGMELQIQTQMLVNSHNLL